MTSFRYQAVEGNGAPVKGTIEANDRKAALDLLSARGLFPSELQVCPSGTNGNGKSNGTGKSSGSASGGGDGKGNVQGTLSPSPVIAVERARRSEFRVGSGVKRKEITAFTREMAALLGAGIPIPQALDGLGQEEENPALREAILQLSESVRKGIAMSAAMEEHPKLFNKLYVSMVRVGEEAGVLQKVMSDLAELLEHEDELRSEIVAAVSYPVFVLGFGIFTVAILLTVVLPKLFGMLQDMLEILPLPTLILLRVSGFFQAYWLPALVVAIGAAAAGRWYARSAHGAFQWDKLKLRLPVMGSVFRTAALSRFSRTLGTLVKSGVSLLPALKIVENTIGNLVLARVVAQVAEETRGGDSLAGPLRKLGIFPRTVVQMISVGEETGKLDEMLLKVADIEERHMRARTKTLVSLLAPALILVVGALVGFMVIALLLPIFKMSRAIH